jgi:hypothetical protein
VTLHVSDVHDFVKEVELDTLFMHEERGRRLRWTDDELLEIVLPVTSSSLAVSRDEARHRFRFRTTFTDQSAEYVADCEVVYILSEDVDVAESVSMEFAERVAFMAVYPYLRASISSSAARLGLPIPLLGIVRQGEFQSGEKMTQEQVQQEFIDDRSETLG